MFAKLAHREVIDIEALCQLANLLSVLLDRFVGLVIVFPEVLVGLRLLFPLCFELDHLVKPSFVLSSEGCG